MGIGYLIWTKIDGKFLADRELNKLLSADLSRSVDPYEQELHRAKTSVWRNIQALRSRQIRNLRTGLSWAEWESPGGRAWIGWYLREYAKHLQVLPCLTYTPPHLGIEPRTNSPPRNLETYADFVASALGRVGRYFREVELWNEWNFDTDWDAGLDGDGDYLAFITMIASAAKIVHRHNKFTVLGGVAGVTERTLGLLASFGKQLHSFDAIGFHNLRGTWGDQNPPPSLGEQVHQITEVLDNSASQFKAKTPKVWLTEYGFPPVDYGTSGLHASVLEHIQTVLFAYAVNELKRGILERVYWYTLQDLRAPSVRFLTTGWEDVLQYFYGDTSESGRLRELALLLVEGGPEHVHRTVLADPDWWQWVLRASLGRKLPKTYTPNSMR